MYCDRKMNASAACKDRVPNCKYLLVKYKLQDSFFVYSTICQEHRQLIKHKKRFRCFNLALTSSKIQNTYC